MENKNYSLEEKLAYYENQLLELAYKIGFAQKRWTAIYGEIQLKRIKEAKGRELEQYRIDKLEEDKKSEAG